MSIMAVFVMHWFCTIGSVVTPGKGDTKSFFHLFPSDHCCTTSDLHPTQAGGRTGSEVYPYNRISAILKLTSRIPIFKESLKI
jgi:hypothetical protein